MRTTSVHLYLLAGAGSALLPLVSAEPVVRLHVHEAVVEGQYTNAINSVRVPAHHVPEAYLGLFDPARHAKVDAQIRSHQQRVIESDEYGSMQQVLASVMPTNERTAAAARENMNDIREQCRHASAAAPSSAATHAATGGRSAPRLLSRVAANEVAGSNLVGATVFAIVGAIGVAVLLV